MKPEQKVWQRLSGKMKGKWFARRVENKWPDIPDVTYTCRGTSGYLELKHLASLPKRPDTIVKFKRFTRGQLNFALDVNRHGGKSPMFAQIGEELFLIDPQGMKMIYDGIRHCDFKTILLDRCLIWPSWSEFNVEEFIEGIV